MTDSLRVLVCGGRNYTDRVAVWSRLSARHTVHRITLLIQGGAGGADLLAKKWAIFNNVPHLTFAAEWKVFGRAAGPIRNKRMLDEGKPDLVIAFPGGRGTADMVEQAKALGVKVEQPYRIEPERTLHD